MDHYQASGFEFELADTGPVDGEAVILLHGFPETRRSWDRVAPQLADAGFRVLAPDQRGYSPGARPPKRSAYRNDRLVGDVIALADAAGSERFHVVGHDWGGAVAWGLAGSHPERVITMTSLATPHPRAMFRSLFTSSQAARSWYMFTLQFPWLPEAALRGRRGKDSFLRQLIASGLPEEDATHYAARLAEAGAATGALNWYRAIPLTPVWQMGTIRVPVLYVYGARDFALGRKAAELTARYVDGEYRFEILEDAGHWLPESEPGEIARLLLEHLGGAGKGAR